MTPQKPENHHQSGKDSFPIVGIGASAGGLEALEGFFEKMPPDNNLAIVIIQHLSPKHKSIMGEILQRHTSMQVFEIKDGVTLTPNCVYLNPPDKQIVIINHRLHLLELDTVQGVHLPIDAFFRSLAEDQGEKAICIVLSGTGTDGTLGLKAIKGAGGMTMTQDTRQAKYAGMPDSAIKTGQVDFILPVEKIPEELIKYVRHPYIERTAQAAIQGEQFQNHARKIFALIRSATGHDFSNYKQTTLGRRIERRMAVHQIETLEEYVRYVQHTPDEVETLFKEMLIGVTNFFRDPDAFEILAEHIIPDLVTRKPHDKPLRVWVPGCATGEEAYSLAILLVESMEQHKKHLTVQIFASDLDANALDAARMGVYPDSIAADVSPERLQRFFVKEENTYRVKKQIREMVVFAVQNLINDPPFSRLDLVSCRNLLIYMDGVLQKKILPLFHYTLLPSGILFLGSSESIGGFTDYFTTLDSKWKIFRRKDTLVPDRHGHPAMPFFERHAPASDFRQNTPPARVDIRNLTEKIALEHYTLPCVLLNDKQEMLYAIGAVDRYLKITPGEPHFNILQMAREGLRYKLSAIIQKAANEQQAVTAKQVKVKQNGGYHCVNVTVRPLSEPLSPPGLLLVVFDEQPAEHEHPQKAAAPEEDADHPQVVSLQQELQSTKEYLQTTIEELETSNEELKSTNEELQSVNEELQSTNEELETSKEELQSTNEELVTVNTELQNKVEELTRANNDINNLLASTDIGTIFLDTALRIKRFTPAMSKIFNLITSDVGRSISDITSTIRYNNFFNDAKGVLDTLNSKEIEVQTDMENWYSMRISPYRTVENMIDGVVITFVDTTKTRQREQAEKDARLYAESILDTTREPLLVLDADLNVQTANTAFYRTFQTTPEHTQGKNIYDVGNGQWDIPKLRELLEEIIPQNTHFENYEVEHDFPNIGRKKMLLNARRIEQTGDQPHLILLAFEDVT